MVDFAPVLHVAVRRLLMRVRAPVDAPTANGADLARGDVKPEAEVALRMRFGWSMAVSTIPLRIKDVFQCCFTAHTANMALHCVSGADFLICPLKDAVGDLAAVPPGIIADTGRA